MHGNFQARVLERVAIAFPRRSSQQPKDRTEVSRIAGRCFTIRDTKEAAGCHCKHRLRATSTKQLWALLSECVPQEQTLKVSDANGLFWEAIPGKRL